MLSPQNKNKDALLLQGSRGHTHHLWGRDRKPLISRTQEKTHYYQASVQETTATSDEVQEMILY